MERSEDVKDFGGWCRLHRNSRLESRVRTSIIEEKGGGGRGEVFFCRAKFGDATNGQKTAEIFRDGRGGWYPVGGPVLQWLKSCYARASCEPLAFTDTLTLPRACICICICVRVGRCRSLAPPRNGRCRCRCLSLSLFLRLLSPFFLSFFPPFPLSLFPLFPIVFSLPSSFFLLLFLSLSFPFLSFPSSAWLLSLFSGQRLAWVHRRGEESFERRKNTRWPDIITRTGRKDRARGGA